MKNSDEMNAGNFEKVAEPLRKFLKNVNQTFKLVSEKVKKQKNT